MTELLERLKSALADRYAVESEIGRGGMATVFLAEDLKHGRKVAIKVLHPELAAVVGTDRFLREIQLSAQLEHPNILTLIDSGEADGLPYFVMPYAEGESLRERLEREGRLPIPDTVAIASEVADGLDHAHRRGVVHRDIKPANVLLSEGHALIADFGVATAVDAAAGERLTHTGLAVGTPAYMSPEQAAGEAEADARSDLYSLGCLVYEMLAGEPPFSGSSAQAIVAGHLSRPVPLLRNRRPEVPLGASAAVERALSKEPADRFTTATELAETLTRAMTAEARAAEERRETGRRRVRRLGAAAAFSAVALTGWWLADTLSRPSIERLAVLPASNLTRDPEQDYFVDGMHETLVTELQRAGISIIARQSVLQYRDTEKSIRQIADELGVDALIVPAVGREKDSVAVDVSVIDGRSELPIWTQSFNRQAEGALGLYREITRLIADEIGVALSEEAEQRLSEPATVDPQAYEAVLRGQFHRRRFTPQDFTIALQYFESALAIDSLYAPAHVGVAWVWISRATAVVSRQEAEPFLEEHLAKALQLDPQLASARFLEAVNLAWGDWDFEAGELAFRRALDLDPDDAETQVFYGHLLAILGRWEEAVPHGELAMELDPLNPFVVGLHGTLLVLVDRAEEAIELLQGMFESNPGAGFGITPLADALHAAGRDEEAFQLRRTFYASRGEQEVVEALDVGLQQGGYAAAWRGAADAFAARARDKRVKDVNVAALYAAAGEGEKAMDWLRVAVEQRDQNAPYMGVIPGFRDLHDHPRFQKLAQDVGVPLLRPERE
jgi:serine/threonine-protein kinase